MDKNKELELHKALSKAWVKHQEKVDALNNFYKGLMPPNVITNPIEMISKAKQLEVEERAALEQRSAAWKAYTEYLKQNVIPPTHQEQP